MLWITLAGWGQPDVLEKPNILVALSVIVVSITLWYISIVTAKKY